MGGSGHVSARPAISHVAFLRAINTGGRRISNADLADAVQSLGYEDIAVYQASGNLLIGGALPVEPGEIASHLRAGLSRTLGYDVPAVVRSAADVHEIATAAPFGDREPSPESKPQVMLMATAPSAREVEAHSTEADQLAVAGGDIHWWPTSGISTSNLDLRGLEATFGTMTVRTLGTITRISARIA